MTVEVEDYQKLNDVESFVSDIALCLDSTLNTLNVFSEMYQRGCGCGRELEHCAQTPTSSFRRDDAISQTLEEKQREVMFLRKKAEALLTKAQNTRALVCQRSLVPSISTKSY
jgi:hypothetical protein